MDRQEILGKFEPLKRQYRKWQAPTLTSAEQAAATRRDQIVTAVTSNLTVESFLEQGSQKRLSLNGQVAEIVEKLKGETGTLNDTQLAVSVLEKRLAEARNVRIAADALELTKQDHKHRMQMKEEEARSRRESDEKSAEDTRTAWQEADEVAIEAFSQKQTRIQNERGRAERTYQYERDRKRAQVKDNFARASTKLEREIADENEARENAHREREQVLIKTEEEKDSNSSKVDQLREKLETEPKAAREAAIHRRSGEAKKEAEAVLRDHELTLVTKDQEALALNAHLARQAETISNLENRIERATEHHNTLATHALNGKKGEA